MEGLLRALNMLICAINFPRRKRTDSVSEIWMAVRHFLLPSFFKKKNSDESVGPGYDCFHWAIYFRKKLIHGEKFTVYCYVKKRRRRKKADYRTVSHVEKIEQRCTHTWEGKKWKDINQNVNPGDLFSWKDCFLCSLYFFQVCLHWIYMQILK